jgi:hypothetical protein
MYLTVMASVSTEYLLSVTNFFFPFSLHRIGINALPNSRIHFIYTKIFLRLGALFVSIVESISVFCDFIHTVYPILPKY